MGGGSNGPGVSGTLTLVEDMKHRPPSLDDSPRLGTETLKSTPTSERNPRNARE